MPALLVAAIVVFLEGLSFGVILPVLSPFAEELGGGVSMAGLLFALSTGPRVIFAPFWGRVSERWGRRWTLAAVSVGTMSASILWGLCGELDGVLWSALIWLLISRAMYGVFAAQSVLGLAVASDVSSPEKRAASMGVLGAGFGLAFTIGPWLGGVFAQQYGGGNLGWLAAAFQLVSIGVILLLLRETHPGRVAPRAAVRTVAFARPTSLLRTATLPAVAWMLLVCFLSTVAYSVLFPTFQPLSERWYGWDLSKTGMALSIFGLIGAFVQGGLIRPMVKRIGERSTAAAGLALLGAGLFWVSSQPGEAGFWAGLALTAVGTGFSVPAILGMMSLAVGEHDQGPVHGLNQSATSLGRAGGYLLGGGVYAAVGPAAAYGFAGLLALVGAGMLAATVRVENSKLEVESID